MWKSRTFKLVLHNIRYQVNGRPEIIIFYNGDNFEAIIDVDR
jgi:hypothetical protein